MPGNRECRRGARPRLTFQLLSCVFVIEHRQLLPPFTHALLRFADPATSYRGLRDAIAPLTRPATPMLNESLSDGAFAAEDPFSI
jgi:hypothetical protein